LQRKLKIKENYFERRKNRKEERDYEFSKG